MAGDLTIYGVRDNVKLIREDRNGHKQFVTLNLNDADLLLSPYYQLQQNDILYVTPNKTKAQSAGIGTSYDDVGFGIFHSGIYCQFAGQYT